MVNPPFIFMSHSWIFTAMMSLGFSSVSVSVPSVALTVPSA